MEYIFTVKILIFINFSPIKIVNMMSQGEFLEQKTKENLFAIHLMTSIRKLYQWKVDDDEDFDYKDILHFFLEWSKHTTYKKSYKLHFNHHFNCDSWMFFTCKKCEKQYVGGTVTLL